MNIKRELGNLMGKKLPKVITANIATSNDAPKKTRKESEHLRRQGKKKAFKVETAQMEERDRKYNRS